MSLERAAVNCNKCYALASKYLSGDDKLYDARNEALRSLISLEVQQALECKVHITEEGKQIIRKNVPQKKIATLEKSLISLHGRMISTTQNKAINACVNCDYSSPRIAEEITNSERYR